MKAVHLWPLLWQTSDGVMCGRHFAELDPAGEAAWRPCNVTCMECLVVLNCALERGLGLLIGTFEGAAVFTPSSLPGVAQKLRDALIAARFKNSRAAT